MASKEKDTSKTSSKSPGQDGDKERTLKDAASGLIDEVEKTGSSLINEVKQLFDSLSEKVSGVAGAAVETTATVAQKVGKDPAQFIGGLLKEVQEAGEASLQAIRESFEALRGRVTSHAKEEPSQAAEKEAAVTVTKKKVAKKTSTTKKVAKKTAATPAAKQPATKKTVAKKVTTKKAASKKKVVAKKATTKKVASKKKVVAKKAPAVGGGSSG